MKTLINLRIFSHPWKGENNNEHSYYACHEIRGLSEPMDTIAVDLADCTYLQLRDIIQEQNSGNIMRRRPFFHEFQQFMQRCPNPLGYDNDALATYRLGVIKSDKGSGLQTGIADIKLIKEREESNLICEVVDGPGTDIVLIPRTQIHPVTDRFADRL